MTRGGPEDDGEAIKARARAEVERTHGAWRRAQKILALTRRPDSRTMALAEAEAAEKAYRRAAYFRDRVFGQTTPGRAADLEADAWRRAHKRDIAAIERLLPSGPMGRGGRREGAGRPSLNPDSGGEAPRWKISMEPTAISGAEEYAEVHGVKPSAALRELATAWRESEKVRAAVAEWRKTRA